MNNKNILKKININILTCILFANIFAYFISNADKSKYISINSFFSGLIFFLFCYLFEKKSFKNLKFIKKEAENTNYPLAIGLFLISIFIIIFICVIILGINNQEALNSVSLVTFFISIMSMLSSSFILIIFTWFIMPAFIIPVLKEPVNKKKRNYKLLKWLFILFLIFYIYKGSEFLLRNNNIENQYSYKAGKIQVESSRKFLKAYNISRNAEEKIKNQKFTPFLYTTESFPYRNYNSAKEFCESLNARIPNATETFHIAFNKGDIWGEKYYWTSDFDGRIPVVLNFNNMTYIITDYKKDTIPLLYCVTDIKDPNQKVIYKNKKIENANILKNLLKQNKKNDSMDLILGNKTKQEKTDSYIDSETTEQDKIEVYEEKIDREKKHVNFNVKIVNSLIFNQLKSQGYNYDENDTIDNIYETNETKLTQKMNRDSSGKHIRLCYFPYTDYNGLNIYNETEIWRQSFCSPSFELTEIQAVPKTRYEKDSYCWGKEGRIPNIPELIGILKSQRKSDIGVRYWTNNEITEGISGKKIPIKIYYKDSRFITVEPAKESTTETALTYCIRNSEEHSSIITNYKSRFFNENGKYYAHDKCPNCTYYELPDTILMH